MADFGFWLALALMGAYHGINPGMGWLFAVARGMQERSRRAVWGSLVPIAVGHLTAIGLTAALLLGFQVYLPADLIRGLAAAALIGFGLYRLARSRHPRWVGFRVGFRDLVTWSFLMATGHGAGLMLIPFLLGGSPQGHHLLHGSVGPPGSAAGLTEVERLGRMLAAVTWHTTVYLAVMSLIAAVVYEKVGLAFLRRAWVNLDVLWAVALVATGLLTLLTA